MKILPPFSSGLAAALKVALVLPAALSAPYLMAATPATPANQADLFRVIGDKLTVTGEVASNSNPKGRAVSVGRRLDGQFQGGHMTLDSSLLSGIAGGGTVSAYGRLDLVNGSKLIGLGTNSYGVRTQGGMLNLSQGSIVQGGLNGVVMLNEAGGLEPNQKAPELHLSGSSVIGERGAAIVVNLPITAKIEVNDGSSLQGGNGNILELTKGGSADMSVRQSALTGDIQVGAGSKLDLGLTSASLQGDIVVDTAGEATLSLDNGSYLQGRLSNVKSLGVAGSSAWDLTDNSQVGELNLEGGRVSFGGAERFYTLDVGSLAGSGTFEMAANFATGEGDRLNVSGQANGEYSLALKASGLELDPVERITVVTTGGGDAEFSLVNGPVDLGAFSYDLTKEGNDWHLDTEKKVISPGTRSVMALFNTAPTVFYGELSSLRTRMGELRYNESKSGAWGRAYGSKYNVAESSGTAYKQTQQGFTLGADAQVGDSQWLVGVLAGHSTSDLDLSRGTTGTVDSYYAGAYTTWLDQDSGYYFDAVAKVNRFDNKSKVAMSDGTQAKGNYKTNGVGASAEFGRHIKLDDGYFVEPFAQVSAVSIQGASYDLDNGLKAEGDRTMSVLGKAGATVGRNFDLGEGRFAQPYLRAAAVHEFAKNNKVKVNDNVFNNDLSGSRAEVGAGIAVSLSERLQLHADIDYSNGDKIEKPFGANVGVRFTW